MLKIIEENELFWQYPVITEKTFYLQNYEDKEYFCFPWATVLDKYVNLEELCSKLTSNLEKYDYYTCCQHIDFRKLIPLFNRLGIKTIYSPHKIKGEDSINGIQIICCPHYAINVEDSNRSIVEGIDLITVPRKYKYSFMGSYQKHYITNIRQKIYSLENTRDDIYIKDTGIWHFQSDVYSPTQNINGNLNESNDHKSKTSLFCKIMLQSRFSLCPVGSGPGTIRFWESLGYGSIPVLLADCYDLPEHKLWDHSIIIIKEDQFDKLNDILDGISVEDEEKMRKNCLQIYKYFKSNYKNSNPLHKIKENNFDCEYTFNNSKTIKLHMYMPMCVAKFFQHTLAYTTNYLEFGGGGTTIMASKYIKGKGHLITSNKSLHNKLTNNISTNFNLNYIDLESTDDFGYPSSKCSTDKITKYSDITNLVDLNSIDTILIKGRFRVSCALSIFNNIKESTVILFDDYTNRNYYNVVEKYYDIVNIVDRMVVLKKKMNIDSPAEISQYIFDPR